MSPGASLIVHADDFGETVEITRGILECIDAGVVTSTSILANMPGTEHALGEAAARGRRTSFGVHLNLCEGSPLTAARSLARRDGRFHSKRSLFLRAVAGRLDLNEVGQEMAAQIRRVRGAGVDVSHLDSHKHLHQLPGVAAAVAVVAKGVGLERVRCTLEEGWWPAGTRPLSALSRLVRLVLARRLRRHLGANALRSPDRVFDVRELMALAGPNERIERLRRLTGVTEMFCHPGTERADREKPGSCSRDEESRYLRSAEFREALDAAGVRLVTYWEV